MKFGFTRDSALWALAALSAVVGYLMADGRNPAEWAYGDWLKAVAAAALWLTGKLSTSPRPHSEEGDAKITPSGR